VIQQSYSAFLLYVLEVSGSSLEYAISCPGWHTSVPPAEVLDLAFICHELFILHTFYFLIHKYPTPWQRNNIVNYPMYVSKNQARREFYTCKMKSILKVLARIENKWQVSNFYWYIFITKSSTSSSICLYDTAVQRSQGPPIFLASWCFFVHVWYASLGGDSILCNVTAYVRQHKESTHMSLLQVGFDPTIPVFER
jgi:hypothetical protein